LNISNRPLLVAFIERWNRTESFGRDDLLVLAKVADLAHTKALKPGKE
jgi:hypothetical protein